MFSEAEDSRSKPVSLVRRIKGLLGVGMYLLLFGLIAEGLALGIRQHIRIPISLAIEIQALITVLCLSVCFSAVIWFNCSLNLVKVHLLNKPKELVTAGPFAYVRHPLYSALVLAIPPLVVIWLSDLLFLVPWVLIVFIAHLLVRLEERGLIDEFGEAYERYQEHVPALLPYKGAGGKRMRGKGT